MSRVEAGAPDRLPWLADEPAAKRPSRRAGRLLPWAAVAIVVVAAIGFWIGVRSVGTDAPPLPLHHAPSTTVQLPAPRPEVAPQVALPTQPQVQPEPAREVRQPAVREIHVAPPRELRSIPAHRPAANVSEPARTPDKAVPTAEPQSLFVAPRPWNPRIVEGASGRIVQVGAFGSTHQAKLGWRYMVRAYPAVAHLPAVVRTSLNSRGRTFYRFQVGTTSQAHSEILCQRMQRIGLSCAVVGLPWKAKVER